MADAVREDGRARSYGALGDNRERRVDLQSCDEAASGNVEFGPPSVVVIGQIEDVSCPRSDRHGLGGGDVVDIGRGHCGVAWTRTVGVIDNVQLGPAHAGGKLRPIGTQSAQSKARGIDQIHGICNLAPKRTLAARHQLSQKANEHGARALGVGVCQRGARHLARADVIEPRRVALEAGFDRPQARCARKLRIQHRDKLVLRRQSPNLLVGLPLVHKPIEHRPRRKLQDRVKYCIVVAHGVGSFLCRERRQNVKTQKNPRHAPCPQKTNRTAVRLSRA